MEGIRHVGERIHGGGDVYITFSKIHGDWYPTTFTSNLLSDRGRISPRCTSTDSVCRFKVKKVSLWDSFKSILATHNYISFLKLTVKRTWNIILVGGWTNPFEKYARQIGSSPQVGVKIPKIFETTS